MSYRKEHHWSFRQRQGLEMPLKRGDARYTTWFGKSTRMSRFAILGDLVSNDQSYINVFPRFTFTPSLSE